MKQNKKFDKEIQSLKKKKWTEECHRVSKADLTVQKEESATRRIGNWKLPRQKNKKEKRMEMSDESLWELWNTMKRNNLHCGILEEEKEKGTESMFKAVMAENVPILEREMDFQIHEAKRIWINNPNRAASKHN